MIGRKLDSRLRFFFIFSLSLLIIKLFIVSSTVIISNDGPRYVNQAQQFLNGDIFTAVKRDNLILYPLLISLFGKLGVDLVLAGELISVFSSVLVLLPLYLLFVKFSNEKVAIASCLVFAVNPVFNKDFFQTGHVPFFQQLAQFDFQLRSQQITGAEGIVLQDFLNGHKTRLILMD